MKEKVHLWRKETESSGKRSVSVKGAWKKEEKRRGGGEGGVAGRKVKFSAASWPAFITALPFAGCVYYHKPRDTANS